MDFEKPAVSIVTPSNSIHWLASAWISIKRQAFENWEWIVVANGELTYDICKTITEGDRRVHICRSENIPGGNVGALKGYGFSMANGHWMVEYDHDDELSVDCLSEVTAALSQGPAFVYSRAAAIRDDGTECFFNPDLGWKHEKLPFHGEKLELLVCPQNPALFPQNIARMHFAPNHVRAWRTSDYRSIGGHDASLAVCDDLDLMCRLFIHSGCQFKEINRCLYKYRMHSGNTFRARSEEIRNLSHLVYDKYIIAIASRFWSRTHACVRLTDNVTESVPPWTEFCVESSDDVLARFGSSEVGLIVANHVVTYGSGITKFLSSAYRVLAHGGMLMVIEDDSRLFDRTVTRKSQSYTIPTYRQGQQGFAYLLIRHRCFYASEWHRERGIRSDERHYVALKDGPRMHDLDYECIFEGACA